MIGIPKRSAAIAQKWAELRRYHKQRRAHRRLTKLVEQRRNSFETQDFARRREAMLKVKRKPSVVLTTGGGNLDSMSDPLIAQPLDIANVGFIENSCTAPVATDAFAPPKQGIGSSESDTGREQNTSSDQVSDHAAPERVRK